MRRAFNGTYPITTPFGVYDAQAYANYPGKKHPGTDYALPPGTPLYAGMSGIVTAYDRDPNLKVGRGKEVSIGFANMSRRTCHMSRIDVANGQFVREGQQIGLSGFTGYVVDAKGKIGTSGGAHLHDEFVLNGAYADLEEYLKEGSMNEGDVHNVYLAAWGRKATADELKRYVGKSWKDIFYPDLQNQCQHLFKQVGTLEKATDPEVVQAVTVLKEKLQK